MRFFFLTIILALFLSGNAAVVDTVTIYSNAMKQERKCIVIRPFIPQQKPLPMPVVYLLHGYAGSYLDWVSRVPDLGRYADMHGIMIVCPDGGFSSWYFDSPIDPSMKFETYIAREVPAFIDSVYSTIPSREGRAITGLSMGGHGAFFLAFRNPDVFGACGSMSGGMDLRSSKNKFDISKRIGDPKTHGDFWENWSVINLIERPLKDSLAIIFDCGLDDFFYADNKKLHEKMLKRGICHDYIERPGNHSWNYWGNAVEYQMVFFRKFFKR